MAELAYVKLDADQIEAEVNKLDGWLVVDGRLSKSFEFASYLDGVAFASKVGYAAEELNHHPEITLGYRKVFVSVNTHDVDGISPYDFELARRIEAL